MIWTFVRYSPAWRIAAWASLFYAALWLVLSQGNEQETMTIAPMMLLMVHKFAIIQAPEAAFRCTFFDAALPVDGRDLWVSKMIVLLGLVWIPALAMSVVRFVVVHNPVVPLLNTAAGYTAVLLAVQSLRIREFHEPVLIGTILLYGGWIIVVVMAVTVHEFAMRMLAGFVLANVVFFLFAWTRVPKCFEVAATKPRATAATRHNREAGAVENSTPMLAWWKILWPIYITYVLVLVIMVCLPGGGWFAGIVMIVPIIVATARSNWVFLAHLPVSPRNLFRVMWAPLPLAMYLGYVASAHIPILTRPMPFSPRITAIDWAINLALLLSWMFSFQFWQWHRMRRWPVAVKALIMALVPFGLISARIAIPSNAFWRRYGADPIPYFAVQWAAMLPQNPWLLAILLIIPLTGLYWLVERTFCEMEYSTTRTIGETLLQGR